MPGMLMRSMVLNEWLCSISGSCPASYQGLHISMQHLLVGDSSLVLQQPASGS
jgi:hypothetical protein